MPIHKIANKQLAAPSQGANATNIESLVLLKPDLVIVGSGQTQTIELLRQFGIAVYVMESGTYKQVKEELSEIAILSGAQKRAQEILNFSDEIVAEVAAKTARQPNKQSIYYAWSGGRIFLPLDESRLPMTLLNSLVLTILFRPMLTSLM